VGERKLKGLKKRKKKEKKRERKGTVEIR